MSFSKIKTAFIFTTALAATSNIYAPQTVETSTPCDTEKLTQDQNTHEQCISRVLRQTLDLSRSFYKQIQNRTPSAEQAANMGISR